MSMLKFLQYHNAVPVAISIMLLGGGTIFAATNPETIYGVSQTVVSVDNTYIAGKNLDAWTPRVSITGVTEDDEYYYVAYRFSTVQLKAYVWQDAADERVMKVSKADLGPYRDLGLYVTEQLKQVIDREMAYLREVQEIERKQISLKTVATAYTGLVGRMLDETTETLPGYQPVVEAPPEPPARDPATIAVNTNPAPPKAPSAPARESQQAGPQDGQPSPGDAQATTTPQASGGGSAADVTPPTIEVLGDNPAYVLVGGAYTDLGAAATDDSNGTLAISVSVNGTQVEKVVLDTATTTEFLIRYETEDAAGNSASAERVVKVVTELPAAPQGPQAPAASTTPPQSGGHPTASSSPASPGASSTPPSAPLPEPTPEPEPEPEESSPPQTASESESAAPAETPAAQTPAPAAPAETPPPPAPEPPPAE